jgi:ferric-dicitrate binding protein FerR (iron transport regulator)
MALQPSSKADVLPGGNKAILVLANGSKITLDSVANGVLATQGNTQIHKLNSGQLAYTVVDKASSDLIYNTLSTPRGGQYQLTLPDGSKVWLNSESTLSYPVAFTGSERKVRLTGEGYFEIAADAARSFRVETSRGSTQVLGTSFNISSYPDDKAAMTTLLTGKIKVNAASQSFVLQPGEQAFDAGSSVSIKHPNLKTVTAWRRGFFNFSDADVTSVVKQLARWYNVEYRFEGVPSTEKVDGLIGRDLKLSEALAVLRTLHINATLIDRTIIIKP